MVVKDENVLCGNLNGRLAVFFIDVAGKFESSVWIEKDVHRVNAKGILDVMSLNVRKNDDVRLIADGPDEEEAVKELVEFLTYKF